MGHLTKYLRSARKKLNSLPKDVQKYIVTAVKKLKTIRAPLAVKSSKAAMPTESV